MLSHLTISNFTIIDQLEMEFGAGMTVLTGETGAGKSILLDALGLCLGDRADAGDIRPGAERAEISATFRSCEAARDWLRQRDLDVGEECILRRSLYREGRSRAYINGQPSTLQDCSELGGLLLDIHAQHAHQSLLRRDVQRSQLDEFAGQAGAAGELRQIAEDWLQLRRQWQELAGHGAERDARAQLLAYQVEELEALELQPGLLEELEQQQRQLANAEQILHTLQGAIEQCGQQEDSTRQLLQSLREDFLRGEAIDSVREMLDSAAIGFGESGLELQRLLDRVEVNPEQLQGVEARLDTLYTVARKHRVRAEELPQTEQRLRRELRELEDGDALVQRLQGQLDELAERYRDEAGKLSRARAAAAGKLTAAVLAQLEELAMQQCRFEVVLHPRDGDSPHPHGMEDIEFRIATNPGQPPAALGKIASGGELSRISLAIQVAALNTSSIPSMVFDEVDSGVGGAVAEVVGRLLRTLSARAQVLCLTHLPQVASLGHRHVRVAKNSDGKMADVSLQVLADDERVDEIARMLGGIEITGQTLAHAREMLARISHQGS